MAFNPDALKERLKREVGRSNLRLELRLLAHDIGVGDMFTAMAVVADGLDRDRKLMTCIYLGADRDGVPIIISPDKRRLLLIDDPDDPIELVASVADAE